MTVKFLVSMAACFACLGILWLIARIMQTPVKFGRSSTGYMLINISGAEPRLEQTLNGLLWLNDNGILRCRIIIIGTEPARRYSNPEDHRAAGLCRPQNCRIKQKSPGGCRGSLSLSCICWLL